MGIAELRNQTQLWMLLKKPALPGEDKEHTLTSSGIPAAPLGGKNLKAIFFPFGELDFLGMN